MGIQIKIVLMIIALSMLATSCTSSIRVETEDIADPGDITNAETYCWDNASLVDIVSGERSTTQYSKVIKNEIDVNLRERGYSLEDECPANMTVAFRVTIKDNIQGYSPQKPYEYENLSSDYGLKWEFGSGERAVKVGQATPAMEVSYYEEGTLHIGVFDSNNKKSWHVSAFKIIDKSHSPSEHRDVLRKTVGVAMKAFPSKGI